jgi:hypothetical protein
LAVMVNPQHANGLSIYHGRRAGPSAIYFFP